MLYCGWLLTKQICAVFYSKISQAMSELKPLKAKLSPETGHYYRVEDGQLTGYSSEMKSPSPLAKEIYGRLINTDFPSSGIAPVIKNEKYTLGVYDELASRNASIGLERDLNTFISELPYNPLVLTFIAAFRYPGGLSDDAFVELFMAQLNLLKDTAGINVKVSDPSCCAFELKDRQFSVWGMHANSPSEKNRFEYPLLIFKYCGREIKKNGALSG
jgi:hypothetical protein